MPSVPAKRTSGRRPGRPGYDRDRLLTVAVRVFNEQGYDSTSMADLSQALGISKSAIYHHVGSKGELLRLAVDHALTGLDQLAADTRAMQAPAIERLEHLVRGAVAVLHERMPYVTLLLRLRGNTADERAALARRRAFDRFVAELVRQAAAAGELRPDVAPALTARLLFGMVNSLVEWYRPTEHGARAVADAVCAVAFDGLRPRG